jgi:predicted nuclease with TOPRIM domain
MTNELKAKLEAAMRQISEKFPAANEIQSSKQTRSRMEKIKGEFPAIRKTFTNDELAQLQKRYEEIEPKLPPTAHRSDIQNEVEAQPYDHAYELYFLTHLLES